jgi:hypothetical protein
MVDGGLIVAKKSGYVGADDQLVELYPDGDPDDDPWLGKILDVNDRIATIRIISAPVSELIGQTRYLTANKYTIVDEIADLSKVPKSTEVKKFFVRR